MVSMGYEVYQKEGNVFVKHGGKVQIEEYDYLVVNDDLDTCVNEVHGIITSEHLKMRRRLEFVTNIREDLQGLMKGE